MNATILLRLFRAFVLSALCVVAGSFGCVAEEQSVKQGPPELLQIVNVFVSSIHDEESNANWTIVTERKYPNSIADRISIGLSSATS